MEIDYTQLVHEDRVHGSLHSDPMVFADEMDRIFVRGWVFVGHESEIPSAGDWVTRRLGRESVIMTRDNTGRVNVLANRCAHRGTALCSAAKGHSTSFQCNYHAWNFSLSGELRAVPYPRGLTKDKSELGLDVAGQVASHRGFVFANLDGRAGSLAEHLGEGGAGMIDRLCDLSPSDRISLSLGWVGHRIQSNWKLWCESDVDGYHFSFVHSSMLQAVEGSYYADSSFDRDEPTDRSRAVDWGRGHTELDARPSHQRELAWIGAGREKLAGYCESLEQAKGAPRAAQLLMDGPPHGMIFPNLFLGEMTIAILEPVSPTEMIHWHTSVQLEGVHESFNRRLVRQADAAMGPASFIVPDDAVTAERIQAGIGAVKPSWAASDRGWIDVSRGLEREHPGELGRIEANVSDETPMRGFWRQYRNVMANRAPRP